MTQTIVEKILSSRCGRPVRAGEVVVCDVDAIIGTDASMPMTIDYFEQMGGTRVHDPSRVICALDHYAPPSSLQTAAFHDRVRRFARTQGATLFEVGEGISHQILVERGRLRGGSLVIGADSHTVTAGALNLCALGVGSSDLAAALLTGRIWLRVPETIQVTIDGTRRQGVDAKDVALAMVGRLGADGADYCAIEFDGTALSGFSIDDRMVLCNLAVEAGAKAATCPFDDVLDAWLAGHPGARGTPVSADSGAACRRRVSIDLTALAPQVALPPSPDRVVPLADAAGTPVHMVFLGTCTGGRADDFRTALRAIRDRGGALAPGVQLVVTPASRGVELELLDDGTMRAFAAMGAVITTPGCGACCGTSGMLPGDGMTVLSTANRNFKARMGNATARIFLASPEACGAAAATGVITSLSEPALRRRQRMLEQPVSRPASKEPLERPEFGPASKEPSGPPVHLGQPAPARPASGENVLSFTGRVRRVGDHINSDYIIASTRKRETLDGAILKRFLLEAVDPSFAASVQPGDLLVAGRNFGCGSAMEVAATVILAAGIRAVLAQSFARAFYRNAINNGLLPIEVDTSSMQEGELIAVAAGSGGTVVTRPDGSQLTTRPLPDIMLGILEAGGLVPFLRRKGGFT